MEEMDKSLDGFCHHEILAPIMRMVREGKHRKMLNTYKGNQDLSLFLPHVCQNRGNVE